MTQTQSKREARPAHYLNKANRTRIYRALYGEPIADISDKGSPETNYSRSLPENWTYTQAEQVFHSLASKEVTTDAGPALVSNGLFPPKRYQFLRSRLDTLKAFSRKSK